jgi:hypothetical protein
MFSVLFPSEIGYVIGTSYYAHDSGDYGPGDGGRATSAKFRGVDSLAAETSGNIYVTDRYYDHIRVLNNSTGITTTVAGNGITGDTGDGGPATSVRLHGPMYIASDAAGIFPSLK